MVLEAETDEIVNNLRGPQDMQRGKAKCIVLRGTRRLMGRKAMSTMHVPGRSAQCGYDAEPWCNPLPSRDRLAVGPMPKMDGGLQVLPATHN